MTSPAWPHGDIEEILPDLFMVTGTNITVYNNVTLQHSRNMIIVREAGKLSLINSVRLSEQGLHALGTLGQIDNIVRTGAFHGRDDAFYLDRYQVPRYLVDGMQNTDQRPTDIILQPHGHMPFSGCSFYPFTTAHQPEAVLHLARHGGILISCDSIKNWLGPDAFFSPETATLYQAQGLFGAASISAIWLQACKVQAADFNKLATLEFQHLFSAHGAPLLHDAHEQLTHSINLVFGDQNSGPAPAPSPT